MPLELDGAPTPRAHKRASTSQHHGYTLVDDYAWLKADNWQEVMRDPEQLPRDIRDYLEAENAYCETVMGGTQALQDDLFEELNRIGTTVFVATHSTTLVSEYNFPTLRLSKGEVTSVLPRKGKIGRRGVKASKGSNGSLSGKESSQ